MDYFGMNEKKYTLHLQPFSGGGEGDIYFIHGMDGKCAKLYHENARNKETEDKLRIMSCNLPEEAILSQIAWPIDVLYTIEHKFVGFVMPRIRATNELVDIYEYPPNDKNKLTLQQKLIVAQNICAVIDGVHKAGFVFGDFNPSNIGVNAQNGLVAFWDTDSYHIKDRNTGKTYRCKVCMDGYVAPELLHKCKNYTYENAPLETFTKETDYFSLAIHIFKLLMNGYTPFNGIEEKRTMDSSIIPGVGNKAIEQDAYCFKQGNRPLSKNVPDKSVLPTEILRLFDKAFISGRNKPELRPSAREWHEALFRYESNLKQCNKEPLHQYRIGLKCCPWCEIDDRFNIGMHNALQKQNDISILKEQSTEVSVAAINNYFNNKGASKPSIKETLVSELLLVIISIFIVINFGVWDAHKWKEELSPEIDRQYGYHISEWNPYEKKLQLTGTLNESNLEDIYTIDLGENNGDSVFELEFTTYASGYHTIMLAVIGEDGNVTEFTSRDNTLFSDGYCLKLPENSTFTVQLKCETGICDYLLNISN